MKKYLLVALLSFFVVGCTTIELGDHGSRTPVNSVAIIVALTKVDYNEYSGWDGRCAGSDTDLNRMTKACRKAGIERIVSLYNEKATTYAVIRQILLASKALEISAKNGKRPLMLIYFSGHGGKAIDYYHIEKNSWNQTLCLYDGQLVDDLLWDTLLKIPKGVRVVFISDSCESGTNYRGGPFIAKAYRETYFRVRETRRHLADLSCDFLHFGGCDDSEVSKGNVTYGGIFTYTLFESIKPEGKTYYQWFIEAKAGMPRVGQVPVMSVLQSEESIFNNSRIEDGPAMK